MLHRILLIVDFYALNFFLNRLSVPGSKPATPGSVGKTLTTPGSGINKTTGSAQKLSPLVTAGDQSTCVATTAGEQTVSMATSLQQDVSSPMTTSQSPMVTSVNTAQSIFTPDSASTNRLVLSI